MKQILVISIAFFLTLSTNAQTWDLSIIIENIKPINSTVPTDSLEFELTTKEYPHVGERRKLATIKSEQNVSFIRTVPIQPNSETLKIYFNKQGFVEIENIGELKGDTLKISSFTLYPDCPLKGTWFRKTVFDNDEDGETDFLNYHEEVKSEFDLNESECSVPDSLTLTINGTDYSSPVKKETSPGKVTTGQGTTNKFLFGEKKYFHFKEIELDLIRTVKIEIKKNGA